MNIAGPSGTNKQLPKPPPQPLLRSMDLKRGENKLEIVQCLISFPWCMTWKWNEIMWHERLWISNCVWILGMYVIIRIMGRVLFWTFPCVLTSLNFTFFFFFEPLIEQDSLFSYCITWRATLHKCNYTLQQRRTQLWLVCSVASYSPCPPMSSLLFSALQ